MKHWQIAEIVERSLNEFIAARFNPGRRSNIEATTENIDWHIAPRPNPSALTIVPIIRMEFSRCRPRDKRTRTVPINCIGKDPLIPGINVEHGHAAAPAAHKANPRSIGKPARNIGAARQTKPSVVSYQRLFADLVAHANKLDGKRRDIVSCVIDLPFSKIICFHSNAL